MGVCVCVRVRDDLNNSMRVHNVNLPLMSQMSAPPRVSYGNTAVISLTAVCRVSFRCAHCVNVLMGAALY